MATIPQRIWIDDADLDALPTSGQEWDQILAWANVDLGSGNAPFCNGDPNANVVSTGVFTTYADSHILAMAIAHRKTPNGRPTGTYLDQVLTGLRQVIGSEYTAPDAEFSAYCIGRNLTGFIVAADMIDLKTVDPLLHAQMVAWLRSIRVKLLHERNATTNGSTDVYRVRSFESMVRERPNNHGISGQQTLMAINMYLGDTVAIEEQAAMYRTWIGDTAEYTGFRFKPIGYPWQAAESGVDPAYNANPNLPKYVGINRPGSTIQGHPVDGCPPEEARRTHWDGTQNLPKESHVFSWPMGVSNYFWTVAAPWTGWIHLLERCGIPALSYGQNALQRFMDFCWNYLWVVDDNTSGTSELGREIDLRPVNPPADPNNRPAGYMRYVPGAQTGIYHLQDDVDTIPMVNYLLGTDYPREYIDPVYYGKPGKSMGHNYYLFGNPQPVAPAPLTLAQPLNEAPLNT